MAYNAWSVVAFETPTSAKWNYLGGNDDYLLNRGGSEGILINGKIVRTVTSNNLTIALKTLAGDDPSATDPVLITINGTVRSVTAALSLTLNAGTNWMNLGAQTTATKGADIFVYLGYRTASSAVFIACAKISYGYTYSDFSSTATDSKYLAYSGSAPASTDIVGVIGRVSVTLSGGAGYTWSIPTANIIINRPIFETRLLSFVMGHSRSVTGYTNAPITNAATYQLIYNKCRFEENHTQNATPGGSGNQIFNIPFPTRQNGSIGIGLNNNTAAMMYLYSPGTYALLWRYDANAECTGGALYYVTGEYFIN